MTFFSSFLLADFILDEPADLREEEDRGRRPHHRSMLAEDEGQENIEDLEKLIQQRYGRQDYDEYDEAETTEVEQQALLPSVKDPKLWMVKCNVIFSHSSSVYAMSDVNLQGLL